MLFVLLSKRFLRMTVLDGFAFVAIHANLLDCYRTPDQGCAVQDPLRSDGQWDNGAEFTKRLLPGDNGPSLFETRFEQADIRHKLIRPYTPRHNGKVERSHRKDNEYFYADHKFYSFEDFKGQLKIHRYKYNRFPIRPLGWLSPNEYLAKYRNNTSASSV